MTNGESTDDGTADDDLHKTKVRPNGLAAHAQGFMAAQQMQGNGSGVPARAARGMLGQDTFEERDVYETLGYKKQLTVEHYWNRYLRQDLAKPIVEAPARKSWGEWPAVDDDDESEEQSEFEQAVSDLDELTDVNPLNALKRADILAGIGHFGVLVIGVADGEDMATPVSPGSVPDDPGEAIQYLTPLPEDAVDEIQPVTDGQSDRFGKPEFYQVDFNQGDRRRNSSLSPTIGSFGGAKLVHHSRVIHIPTEHTMESDLLGRPRLEACWNRLVDVEKLVGSTAEMAWRGADYGLVLNTDPDALASMSDNMYETWKDDVEDEAQAWYHGLQPYMRMAGMEVETLGGDMTDPTGAVQTQLKLISAATSIPIRILVGSERGELASSQDEAAWLGYVSDRQESYNSPVIFRAFIDRLREWDVLPDPSGGRYDVEWPELFELNELEQADVMAQKAQALSKGANALVTAEIMTPGEFRKEVLGWDAEVGSEAGEAVPSADVTPPVDPERDGTEPPADPGGDDPDDGEQPDTGPADDELDRLRDELDENDPQVVEMFKRLRSD